MNVPIGPSTVAGYTVTLTGFITALVMYLTGNGGGGQELAIICSTGAALVVFLVTQVGRYAQAHAAMALPHTVVVPADPAAPPAVPRSNG